MILDNVGESAHVDWFIISMSNIYYQYYKGFLILLNFWSSFIYAYCSTYMEHLSESAMIRFKILDQFFEIIFVLSMILNCFVEYHYPASKFVERDLKTLIKLYVKDGRFIYDLVTIVPYHRIFRPWLALKYYRLFYLVKVTRIINAFRLLDPKIYMK